MKPLVKAHERVSSSHLRSARFAAAVSLAGLFASGLGCTGSVDGAGAGAGATGSMTPGAAGSGQGGSSDPTQIPAGDPYAIPTSKPASPLVATPRVARLSRQQWSNTVRDLLKLSDIADIDKDVSGDALVGFDDEAEALVVTEQLRRQLADAAEKLADKVTGDATALAALVPPNAPADAAGRARAFITSFGQHAFRRPLTDDEITTHVGLFNQGPTLYPSVDAFKAGASVVIQAMLQSPHFLYRTELASAAPGATKVALTDYEVASKLAFALTNTMPDEDLFAAAAAGKLHDSAGIVEQAKRLMDGTHGVAGVNNLNMQVYRLGTYDGITRDAMTFPDFTAQTPASMRQEVLQFLDWVFTQGKGVKDFYTAPVGFVNSSLAPLYGVNGNFTADAFTNTALDPTQRSGLLTQAGFLSSYISGDEPDIIHRGVFIATRLLCKELPPPDPKATALVAFEPNMTNRERVEKTTGKGTCGEACHAALFNPLGYAFENYDAIGKYRTMDRGKPVNAADSYALDDSMKSFTNGIELSHLLADAKETHACYVKNMMTYLHGRVTVPEDTQTIDYYARLSRAGMISLHDLELAIVTSDAFLTRLP